MKDVENKWISNSGCIHPAKSLDEYNSGEDQLVCQGIVNKNWGRLEFAVDIVQVIWLDKLSPGNRRSDEKIKIINKFIKLINDSCQIHSYDKESDEETAIEYDYQHFSLKF